MGNGRLDNGEWLLVGQSIFSDDGSVELRMQDDGKLAVYYDDECQWQSTAEQRWDIKGAIMQEDGNFVIYDSTGDEATWHTDTAGGTGDDTTFVAVQDDGNIVLYKDGDDAIWATSSNK
ncbi:Mannose-specific lectin [Fusarium albosuccineum]|uniref:Mannose-specific lectin n=1 Tax=Fusarium albosuccineum TaxID=1237068 RepID=A0A8H4L0K9_9HYPO|nr:Mannose-specific lectin [Fusarium albosuccineum]